MSRNRISQPDTVFQCPACKTEVEGTYVLDVNGLVLNAGKGTAEVELVGLKVDHNCIPEVLRQEKPLRGNPNR